MSDFRAKKNCWILYNVVSIYSNGGNYMEISMKNYRNHNVKIFFQLSDYTCESPTRYEENWIRLLKISRLIQNSQISKMTFGTKVPIQNKLYKVHCPMPVEGSNKFLDFSRSLYLNIKISMSWNFNSKIIHASHTFFFVLIVSRLNFKTVYW